MGGWRRVAYLGASRIRQASERDAFLGILLQFVAQGADRNAEDVGGVCPLPKQWCSVSMMRSRSTSATVLPTIGTDACPSPFTAVPPGCRRLFRLIEHDGVGVDFVLLCQKDRAMDGIFEFADVAAPRMRAQALFGLGAERFLVDAVGFCIFLREELRQQHDVRGAFAQRR